MDLRELSEKEVRDLGLPDHCTQVQAWDGDTFSVIKTVDVIEGDPELHVSICGLPLHKCIEVLEQLFGDTKFEVGSSNGPVQHFWAKEW
jgi:hypothetical protein